MVELSELIKLDNERKEFMFNLDSHLRDLLGTRYKVYSDIHEYLDCICLSLRDYGIELNSKCVETNYKITNNSELSSILSARNKKYLKFALKSLGKGKLVSESSNEGDKFSQLIENNKKVNESISKLESHIKGVLNSEDISYGVYVEFESHNDRVEVKICGDEYAEDIVYIEEDIDFANIMKINNQDNLLDYLLNL